MTKLDNMTHWPDCWREHHDCAIAKIEVIMTLTDDDLKKAEAFCAKTLKGFDFVNFAHDFIPRACAELRAANKEISRLKELGRASLKIFIEAADDFQAAVTALGEIKDGKTMFERSPSKEPDCYAAWMNLNGTGRKLREVVDTLRPALATTTPEHVKVEQSAEAKLAQAERERDEAVNVMAAMRAALQALLDICMTQDGEEPIFPQQMQKARVALSSTIGADVAEVVRAAQQLCNSEEYIGEALIEPLVKALARLGRKP